MFVQPMVFHKWIYAILVCSSFMCEGFMGGFIPTMSLKVFGSHRGSEVFSYLYASFGT